MKRKDSLFPIGLVRKTHGILGECRVSFYRPWFSELFVAVSSVHIRDNAFSVGTVRHLPSDTLIKFKEINTLEDAMVLRGGEMLVSHQELQSFLKKHDYPLPDLWIDYLAIDINGHSFGRVSEVILTGSNDVLSIISEKEELLVPVIPEYILKIDPEKQEITIRYPEMV